MSHPTGGEEGFQITGLELLTDETINDKKKKKPQHTTTNAKKPKAKAKSKITAQPALSPIHQKPRLVMNRSKPAPAFIRGGNKPLSRTKSLPRSFQRPDAAMAKPISPKRGKLKKTKSQQGRRMSTDQRRPSLPRVSRRVSIGNEEVGVTKTTWGQKPQRKPSLSGGSNHGKQQQQHQQGNYNSLTTPPPPAALKNTSDHDSVSRRSSISSNGSNFSDYDISDEDDAPPAKGPYIGNSSRSNNNDPMGHSSSGRGIPQRILSDNHSVVSEYSYANDSLDLRRNSNNRKKQQQQQQQPSRTGRSRQRPYDEEEYYDDLDDDSCANDTYANDSLDLRQYNKKKLGYGDEDEDFDDDLLDDDDDDDADTYANDSLDLRQYNKKKLARENNNQEDDDLDDDDDDSCDGDTYAGDSLDLRQYNKKKLTRKVSEGLDDSAAGSAYSYAVDSVDFRSFRRNIQRKTSVEQQQQQPSNQDLGYGNSPPTTEDLGYEQEPQPLAKQESWDDDASFDAYNSNKTPVDYMTRIVMGYQKKSNGGPEMRRMSNESTACSIYSYACDSVAMKPTKQRKTKLQEPAPPAKQAVDTKKMYANTEGYDDCSDDDEDYSDSSHHGGNNPYLSAMMGYGDAAGGGRRSSAQVKQSQSHDAGMERRFSCNSYSNDSVDLRMFKKDPSYNDGSGRRGSTQRRESMDESVGSAISARGLDPDYLNEIMGYALQPGTNIGGTANKNNNSLMAVPRQTEDPGPRQLLVTTEPDMMDSFTSIGSAGDWALSPSRPSQPKVSLSASKVMQASMTSLGGVGMAFRSQAEEEDCEYEDMGMAAASSGSAD
ncbi:expressed unknown protein [Seminavis robusta]|uniref:Uncharacterized protein n=1 Tax=Seminavis robusta TaxID=568900 RepID=A0A9N8DVN6_9STRA|nr:expressed unknown protein [Seminavis robusta]|eukprot:Sro316_g115620.1 n/a (823) ;mRNA; f:72205-74844